MTGLRCTVGCCASGSAPDNRTAAPPRAIVNVRNETSLRANIAVLRAQLLCASRGPAPADLRSETIWSMPLTSLTPIDTRHLFRPVSVAFVELLHGLDTSEW